MKKILAMLLAALMIASLAACSKDDTDTDTSDSVNNSSTKVENNVYEDFTYGVNAFGDYEITGFTYIGAELIDVTVPSQIDNRPVTGIGVDAFKACQNIKSVTLPSSITYIDSYAFYDCDYLTAITLPDSITRIGDGAFQNCSALTTVTFSKGLLEIGSFAFMDCKVLGAAELSEGLLSIGNGAFWQCDALTAMTIPTTVINIGDAAFYGCGALAKITMLGTIAEADQAILSAMNNAIASAKEAPEDFSDVVDIFEAAGIYLNKLNDGCKYVWDKTSNQIFGAITEADAETVTKMNAALAAKVPTSFGEIASILATAELEIDKLNDDVTCNKFTWDATSNKMTTIQIGEVAFAGCAADLTVTVTAGSPFAEYAAANDITVAG